VEDGVHQWQDGGTFTTLPGTPATVGRAHTSGSTATVPVGCRGRERCKLTLTLTATERLKGGRVIAVTARTPNRPITTKLVTLGNVIASVPAGQARTVRVALNATGRRFLARFHQLKAKLTIAQSGAVLTRPTLTFHAR
jgi:hypothetical protein